MRAAIFAALHRQLMEISLPCPLVEPTCELMGVFVSSVCQPAAVCVLITPLEHSLLPVHIADGRLR